MAGSRSSTSSPKTRPLGFDKSGRVLYLKNSREKNTSAMVAANLDTGELTTLAEDPRADVSDDIAHPPPRKTCKPWRSRTSGRSGRYSTIRSPLTWITSVRWPTETSRSSAGPSITRAGSWPTSWTTARCATTSTTRSPGMRCPCLPTEASWRGSRWPTCARC